MFIVDDGVLLKTYGKIKPPYFHCAKEDRFFEGHHVRRQEGGVGGSTPPNSLATFVLYSRYSLICRKKTKILVLASSAIVVTSQHKPTVLTLLNYEV